MVGLESQPLLNTPFAECVVERGAAVANPITERYRTQGRGNEIHRSMRSMRFIRLVARVARSRYGAGACLLKRHAGVRPAWDGLIKKGAVNATAPFRDDCWKSLDPLEDRIAHAGGGHAVFAIGAGGDVAGAVAVLDCLGHGLIDGIRGGVFTQ